MTDAEINAEIERDLMETMQARWPGFSFSWKNNAVGEPAAFNNLTRGGFIRGLVARGDGVAELKQEMGTVFRARQHYLVVEHPWP